MFGVRLSVGIGIPLSCNKHHCVKRHENLPCFFEGLQKTQWFSVKKRDCNSLHFVVAFAEFFSLLYLYKALLPNSTLFCLSLHSVIFSNEYVLCSLVSYYCSATVVTGFERPYRSYSHYVVYSFSLFTD